MPTYRISIHTGPTGVHEVAEKLTNHLILGVTEGTEHVYFPLHADDAIEAVMDGEDIVRMAFGLASGLYRGIRAEKTRD